MNLTLTNMEGNTKQMKMNSKEDVTKFISLYRSSLKKNQRVKITCDLLSIDGYIQGVREI